MNQILLELRIYSTKLSNLFFKKNFNQPSQKKKVAIVKKYAGQFDLDIFIETGTYAGDMIDAVKNDFGKIYSIELNKDLFNRAQRRFREYNHIHILHGDSSEVLPKLLQRVTRASLFWLDAHCSGGVTTRGDLETPVAKELLFIIEHPVKRHAILIDDADLFVGTHDYPTFKRVRELVKSKAPHYSVSKKDNVIRISNKRRA